MRHATRRVCSRAACATPVCACSTADYATPLSFLFYSRILPGRFFHILTLNCVLQQYVRPLDVSVSVYSRLCCLDVSVLQQLVLSLRVFLYCTAICAHPGRVWSTAACHGPESDVIDQSVLPWTCLFYSILCCPGHVCSTAACPVPELHVYNCTHWLRPPQLPPLSAFGLIYEGAIGQPR